MENKNSGLKLLKICPGTYNLTTNVHFTLILDNGSSNELDDRN